MLLKSGSLRAADVSLIWCQPISGSAAASTGA
jgi:hypothetical protein